MSYDSRFVRIHDINFCHVKFIWIEHNELITLPICESKMLMVRTTMKQTVVMTVQDVLLFMTAEMYQAWTKLHFTFSSQNQSAPDPFSK